MKISFRFLFRFLGSAVAPSGSAVASLGGAACSPRVGGDGGIDWRLRRWQQEKVLNIFDVSDVSDVCNPLPGVFGS